MKSHSVTAGQISRKEFFGKSIVAQFFLSSTAVPTLRKSRSKSAGSSETRSGSLAWQYSIQNFIVSVSRIA